MDDQLPPANPDALPRRKVWIAALLALGFGALSIIYCGRLRRAVGWMLTALLNGLLACGLILYWAHNPVSLALCFGILVWPFFGILVDAIRLARQSAPAPRRPYQRLWVYIVVAAALWFTQPLLAASIKRTWMEGFFVPVRSMSDTILAGDRFLLDRLVLSLRGPRRDEIVAFQSEGPERPILVKRLIGLPGDVIEIRDERVFRNGEQLDEPFAKHEGQLPRAMPQLINLGPLTVPDDAVFMLGDNRRASKDSRFEGPYRLADVLGVARVVYWSRGYESSFDPRTFSPVDKWGNLRWQRFGARLDSSPR